ncbi:uncharacterized protein, partial [Notothenia coriiceps]|uniref:Uncharacterized protein n=1 Tax=Notothenia coriiceps TaxID=8208 RepID=A0A6I9PJV1_9TELE
MEYTDKEEHHEETDPSPDPCCEEGKNTPAAPQSDLRRCLKNLVGWLRVFLQWITLMWRNIMEYQIPSLTRAVRKERTLQHEHHEETDPSPDPCCEEGKNTPAAPQSDHVPPPGKVAGCRLQLDYSGCETNSGSLTVDNAETVTVKALIHGTECTISFTKIADNGNQIKATSLSVSTEHSTPVQNKVDQLSRESESLPPAGELAEVESNNVTWCSEVGTLQEKADGTLRKPTAPSAPK